MSSPYTTLGLPPDGVAWVALAATPVLVLALRGPGLRALSRALPAPVRRPVLALAAALLSVGYVAYYLRGGPRIVDATSYYLQARAMATGQFAFPVPAPLASFNGRFLLANDSGSMSVIFPPGYAAILALGFVAHVPLLVGPLLAALIVLATYGIARELSGRDDTALVAAVLSVMCAALRYHTADTMSHGLCALLFSAGTLAALRGKRAQHVVASGLCFGWLIATRPVSGVVGVGLAVLLLERSKPRLLWLALGLLPGMALLLAYQRVAAGSFWSSPQLAYYARADGPPGCFRYGFGPGIGCLFEHGDYVRARLPEGYGLLEAASVSLRRLAVHSIDIANAAPLSLLCFVAAWQGRADARVRAIFGACVGLMVAYAPFYFDASYPGGGARLFADVLPLEHVLLALALVRLRWHALALPASLLGFAVHGSFAHRALAEREGGRPMFDSTTLERAGVEHGLVFIDTDHGFNLGHEPGQLDAQRHLLVARYERDAHDFELWDRLGRPASYRYSYAVAGKDAGRHALVPYIPAPALPLRYEAEADWPPLAVTAGWVQPDFVPCASQGRGLRLNPTGRGPEVALELSAPASLHGGKARSLRLGWVRSAGPATAITVISGGLSASALVPAGPADCLPVPLFTELAQALPPQLPVAESRIRLLASRAGVLDYLEILPE